MTKLKKSIPENEGMELKRLFKDKHFYIESVNGFIVKIESEHKDIINWAKTKKLV